MKKLFKIGCFKTHTKGDGPLLDLPAAQYATSSNWNTPPLTKGAMQRGPFYQASPARPIAGQASNGGRLDDNQDQDIQSLQTMAKQGADELELLRNSQRILKAKSRVLELICKDIRDRYKALDLPPDMPLPPSTAPEGETLAAMTARADPDTRRIVEAGQKVLAMLAAISQISKEAVQDQDKVRSDLFTAQAAKTRAESKAAQARHLSDARAQALHKVNQKLKDLEVQNKGLKDALAKALRESGTEMVPDMLYGADDTPAQSLNPMQQRMLSDCLKENKAPGDLSDSGTGPLKENWKNRGHNMSSSLSGEKLKALRHDPTVARAFGHAHDALAQPELSEVSLQQTSSVIAAPETTGKLAGHAADVAALSQHNSSPLRPVLKPPVAVQRSPPRNHRRQLSTVTEETFVPEEAAPDAYARPALPLLDLQPLMQQQVAYTGPQELYQSTAYTSETTDIRTSATVSNLSETAANHSSAFASQQQQSQQQDDDAESQATDTPPLINFTPPPRQAVAKLAKVFQPGPSRLSNSSTDVTASRAWSPLKHHAKARQETAAEDGAGSRLAVGSGPRESHLDFFLRDAAAATANFRISQGPGVGPLQNHIHISAADQGFFGAYDAAVHHPPQNPDAYVRSRAHSTVSSHSNPLFTARPEEAVQHDTQPGIHPHPSQRDSLESRASSAAMTAGAEGPAAEIKQSVVASTATRLANHATPQPHPQPGAAADFGSATQAGWGCGDMQQRNREKTPDTNVKLNQPLRCGRYGQDLIAHKQQRSAQQPGNLPSRIPRLTQHAQQATIGGANRNPALVASRHSTSAAQVTHTQQGRNMNVATAATTAMPRANAPNGQQHKSNSQSAAAPAASVDELLIGQPSAVAAGSTSVQTAATAAAPKNRTDTAALKQDFLQHLATRPVARAPTSGRSSVDELLTAVSSAQATGLQTAATQHGTHVRAAAVDSSNAIVQQRATVRHQQHVQQQSGVMLDDVIDSQDIPLRMQYSISSNSGSRSSTSSWQTTSDSSAMQCCGTLPDQHGNGGQGESLAAQLPYGHLGSGQTSAQQTDSESRAVAHAEQHQQPLPRRDADDWVANGTSVEEGLRRSNDKLDMLLQSTVKKSQQAVIGKENRGRQVQSKSRLPKAGTRMNRPARESGKALRDYKQ